MHIFNGPGMSPMVQGSFEDDAPAEPDPVTGLAQACFGVEVLGIVKLVLEGDDAARRRPGWCLRRAEPAPVRPDAAGGGSSDGDHRRNVGGQELRLVQARRNPESRRSAASEALGANVPGPIRWCRDAEPCVGGWARECMREARISGPVRRGWPGVPWLTGGC
jgi:hypothetical protein